MKNIKYKNIYIPLLLLILTSVLFFTSCTSSASESVSKDEILKKFSEISSIPRSSDNLGEIKSYIYDWANENEFAVINDIYGNIIVDKKASDGRSKEKKVILQSYMDMVPYQDSNIIFDEKNDGVILNINEKTGNIKAEGTNLGAESSLGMANIMYIMENIQSNPPLRAIFTVNGSSDMMGAKNINSAYLEGDLLINFNHKKHNCIVNQSYYSQSINFTSKVDPARAYNKKVYVIAAVNSNEKSNSEKDERPTPIKSTSDILADANNQGIMFEIASIKGGDSNNSTPTQVVTTIILNEFESRQMSSIVNKYSSENEVPVSMIETKKTKEIVDMDDSSRIISFLFNISESNITSIDLDAKHFKATVLLQAQDEVELKNSIEEQTMIGNLSNINLTKTNYYPGYYSSPLSSWIKRFPEKNNELEMIDSLNELGFFARKNPKLQVLSIGANIKNSGTTKELVALNTIDYPATTIILLLGGVNETS